MTTVVNSFQDILDALEQNPEYRNAMRRLVLDEEFLRLPAIVRELQETVADLARTVREYMAVTNARLDRLEAGQQELLAGQRELRAGYQELRGGQEVLQAGQDELQAGQDELRAGYRELRGGQEELQAGQDELRANQARMQGQLNNLIGTDYERRVARIIRRYAIRRLNLYNATVLYSVTMPDNNAIQQLLDDAVGSGLITNEMGDDMAETDLVLSGNFRAADGEFGYVLVEVSITVFEPDVDRAQTRAAILAQASQLPVTAVVVGETIHESTGEYAVRNRVTVVRITQ